MNYIVHSPRIPCAPTMGRITLASKHIAARITCSTREESLVSQYLPLLTIQVLVVQTVGAAGRGTNGHMLHTAQIPRNGFSIQRHSVLPVRSKGRYYYNAFVSSSRLLGYSVT